MRWPPRPLRPDLELAAVRPGQPDAPGVRAVGAVRRLLGEQAAVARGGLAGPHPHRDGELAADDAPLACTIEQSAVYLQQAVWRLHGGTKDVNITHHGL